MYVVSISKDKATVSHRAAAVSASNDTLRTTPDSPEQRFRAPGRSFRSARLWLVVSCLLAVPSCKRASNEPVDGWAAVRAELFEESGGKSHPEDTRATNCFLSRPAYCIRDQATLEAIVQPLLDEHFKGKMPSKSADVRRLAKQVVSAYRKYYRTAEGMTAVQALLRARYDEPVVTTKDGTVTLDHGFLPFEIGIGSRGEVRVQRSDVIEGGTWKASALGAKLKAAAAAHPDAKVLHLEARIPTDSGRGTSLSGEPIHVWHRLGTRRLVMADSEARSATRHIATLPADGLAALAAGQVSLSKESLTPCYPAKRGMGEGDTPNCQP